MRRWNPRWRPTLLAGAMLIGSAVLLAALWLPIAEIPTTLPAVDPALDLAALIVTGTEGRPDLRLGSLRGRRVALLVVDERAALAMEGFRLRNALMRWMLPENLVVLEVIVCAQLPGLMSSMLERMAALLSETSRFPLYLDPAGAIPAAFRLPSGHLGLVVLDEQGQILLRQSGEAGPEQLARIAATLRAAEPPPVPRAPPFRLADVEPIPPDDRATVIAFLGRTVREQELRGLLFLRMGEILADPSLRVIDQLASRWRLDPARVRVIIAGDLRGFAGEAWLRQTDSAALRAAFGIAADQAGLAVIDEHGGLQFLGTGSLPMWRLGLAAESIGIEPRPMLGGG